jgi:GTPase SAR1 family protein
MFKKLKALFDRRELCPYCFEYFELEDTPFRCSSPQSICEWEDDEIYKQHWGDSRKKGHIIQNNQGDVKFVICDKCNQKTFKRLCPHCHKELPSTTGEVKNHIFAVIGSAGAGKSHYIAVLINKIQNELGPKMRILLNPLNDETRTKYRKEFYSPIFEKHETIQKTNSAMSNTSVKLPLVYGLSFVKDTMFEKNKIVAYITLVFFDTAGEDLNSEDTMATVNKYIYRSNGIILLIDPLQIEDVRSKLLGKVPMPGSISASSHDILSRVTSLIEKGQELGPRDKIDIPLAVSFTKFDALDSIIDDAYQIKQNSNHSEGYNEDDVNAVNSEMKSLLMAWNQASVVQLAETKYKTSAFFGVSALGCNPHKDNKIPNVNPRRVEDPFLWLLKVNKIL